MQSQAVRVLCEATDCAPYSRHAQKPRAHLAALCPDEHALCTRLGSCDSALHVNPPRCTKMFPSRPKEA